MTADDLLGQHLVDAREEERRAWASEHIPQVGSSFLSPSGYQPFCSCGWHGAMYESEADALSRADLHVWAVSPAPLVDRDTGDEG